MHPQSYSKWITITLMITIQLNPSVEERLKQLALARGQDASQLAQRVIEEYLDLQGWTPDSAEDWAAASSALAPEILPEETWTDGDLGHGSR
jgi:predicted transcriptional regulator